MSFLILRNPAAHYISTQCASQTRRNPYIVLFRKKQFVIWLTDNALFLERRLSRKGRFFSPLGSLQQVLLAFGKGKHFSGAGINSSLINGTNSEDVDIYHLDSVNIDTEMTHLVENNIKYRTSTEMLLRKLDKLRYAIREGGR